MNHVVLHICKSRWHDDGLLFAALLFSGAVKTKQIAWPPREKTKKRRALSAPSVLYFDGYVFLSYGFWRLHCLFSSTTSKVPRPGPSSFFFSAARLGQSPSSGNWADTKRELK
eukprot:s122_g12.t1